MEKLTFYKLSNEKYIGIITILDYEIRLNNCLSELSFLPDENNREKVIVDLALKSGDNQYRFVEFNVDSRGKIILGSDKYVNVTNDIKITANRLLKKKKEIILNSILPDSKKKEILSMHSMV